MTDRTGDEEADRLRAPSRPERVETNDHLRVERENADSLSGVNADADADEVVRLARARADEIVQSARANADGDEADHGASEHERNRADDRLDDERSSADALLTQERAADRRDRSIRLAEERHATDKSLRGERAVSDAMNRDQREANEAMVHATITADEQTGEAEQREKDLRQMAELRELFIGILGHDLRNPVAAITIAAEHLLRRGHLDDHDKGAANRIIRSSHRIGRMITQLLDLTRARLGGGMPVDRKPTDLGEICRNVVDEFAARVELRSTGDLTGTWDPDRLAEVLSNLAGNAVDYAAPETTVVVEARAEGDEVIVEVRNRGAPIPAEALPFIFEPFRRAKQGESSPTGNLGLGLYIAKQIVLAHGGTLEAASAHGTTTFVMRLPRHVVTQ